MDMQFDGKGEPKHFLNSKDVNVFETVFSSPKLYEFRHGAANDMAGHPVIRGQLQ